MHFFFFSELEVAFVGGWTGTVILDTVDKLNIQTGMNTRKIKLTH